MEDFVSNAIKKIEGGLSSVRGSKENVVKRPVADALISFCRQQEEFAQAVVQSEKTFAECVGHVLKESGNALSDIEAYQKAVGFWFPGAIVDMVLTIRMSEFEKAPEVSPKVLEKREVSKSQTTGNLEFSLLDLL